MTLVAGLPRRAGSSDISGILVAPGSGLIMTACSFGSNKWPHWAAPGTTILRVSVGGRTDQYWAGLADEGLVRAALQRTRDRRSSGAPEQEVDRACAPLGLAGKPLARFDASILGRPPGPSGRRKSEPWPPRPDGEAWPAPATTGSACRRALARAGGRREKCCPRWRRWGSQRRRPGSWTTSPLAAFPRRKWPPRGVRW